MLSRRDTFKSLLGLAAATVLPASALAKLATNQPLTPSLPAGGPPARGVEHVPDSAFYSLLDGIDSRYHDTFIKLFRNQWLYQNNNDVGKHFIKYAIPLVRRVIPKLLPFVDIEVTDMSVLGALPYYNVPLRTSYIPHALDDIRDSHGLCAEVEMAALMADELFYEFFDHNVAAKRNFNDMFGPWNASPNCAFGIHCDYFVISELASSKLGFGIEFPLVYSPGTINGIPVWVNRLLPSNRVIPCKKNKIQISTFLTRDSKIVVDESNFCPRINFGSQFRFEANHVFLKPREFELTYELAGEKLGLPEINKYC